MNQNFYEGIKNILTTARIKSIKQPILQWLKPAGIQANQSLKNKPAKLTNDQI